jgi:hypothetical protein
VIFAVAGFSPDVTRTLYFQWRLTAGVWPAAVSVALSLFAVVG